MVGACSENYTTGQVALALSIQHPVSALWEPALTIRHNTHGRNLYLKIMMPKCTISIMWMVKLSPVLVSQFEEVKVDSHPPWFRNRRSYGRMRVNMSSFSKAQKRPSESPKGRKRRCDCNSVSRSRYECDHCS